MFILVKAFFLYESELWPGASTTSASSQAFYAQHNVCIQKVLTVYLSQAFLRGQSPG